MYNQVCHVRSDSSSIIHSETAINNNDDDDDDDDEGADLCELIQAVGELAGVWALVVVVLRPSARAVTPAPRPFLLRGGARAGHDTRQEGHETGQRLRPPVNIIHHIKSLFALH